MFRHTRTVHTVAGVLLIAFLGQGRACSCGDRPLCDDVDYASVVLRAQVLERVTSADQFADVTYSVNAVTLYKSEDGMVDGDEITFVTRANGGLCGIYLELDQEYLLDLVRYEDGSLNAVGLCGLVTLWSSVSEEELALLEGGCDLDDDEDACEGACDEFQECLTYAGGSLSYNYSTTEEEYYCADVCDPSPCLDTEECSLVEVECASNPCPPVAECEVADAVSPAESNPTITEDRTTDEDTASATLRAGAVIYATALTLSASFVLLRPS